MLPCPVFWRHFVGASEPGSSVGPRARERHSDCAFCHGCARPSADQAGLVRLRGAGFLSARRPLCARPRDTCSGRSGQRPSQERAQAPGTAIQGIGAVISATPAEAAGRPGWGAGGLAAPWLRVQTLSTVPAA